MRRCLVFGLSHLVWSNRTRGIAATTAYQRR